MKRRLLNFVAALSLVLCAASVAAWVRSQRGSDRLAWGRADGLRSVESARGHLVVDWVVDPRPGRSADFRGLRYTRGDALSPINYLLFLCTDGAETRRAAAWAGFAWYERRNAGVGAARVRAVAPLWSVGAATAAPPAWAAMGLAARLRRRRRVRSGRCAGCRYDLTGNVSGVCPECGATVSTKG